MIELGGRLINPSHVAIIENMPGKEGYVRVYVGGVALIVPGTIASVKALIYPQEAPAHVEPKLVDVKKPKKGKAGEG